MATKPLNVNPTADLPENWTNGQTVAPSGSSVGLSTQHGYNYLMSKVNEALTDIGTINNAFEGTVPSPATTTPSDVGASGNVGSSTLYARADHVHKGPQAGTGNPSMDGTAAAGTASTWSRSDHVHPTDTSRQAKITASGILKGDGSGGVSANGTISVGDGGTGRSTLTSNAILAGNGTSAVKMISTANGALYATGTGAASFGTLPAAQGGTGQTTLQAARNAMGLGNTTGALPIANGGTGQTTAGAAINALGLGRSTAVTADDPNYTSYMVRGEALFTSDTTPPYHGQIAWTYY